MSLEPGRRLGSFDIVELLGQGGMGEVYRARDTRLHRDVALKVLPDRYASDSERLARFRREALALASLVHPHIATLFGIEECGVTTALVMELVDGETLGDRIARHRDPGGRGLPLDEVLKLAGELADALDAAHHRGVIHRDLKPANIKVNAEDSVKVLDFGLASILTPPTDADVTAETITMATQETVLGTPAYMSPEQVRGEPTDQRADVWAFGCVLYEMLTGRRAFGGRSTVEALACVLEREPDLNALPPHTPPAIRRLLRRALSKNPRTRLHDMGDARLEINDAIARTEEVTPSPRVATRRATMLFAAALAGVAVAALLGSSLLRPRSVPPPISRFEIAGPTGETSVAGCLPVEKSPFRAMARVWCFARTVAFSFATATEFPSSHSRSGPLAAAGGPFFSPDGRWIAYTTEGALKKVAVSGGAPVELVKTATYASGAWAGDRIVYADGTGLYRVSQEGGTPEKLPVNLASSEQVAFPEVLPDGQAILFSVMPTRTNILGLASQSRQARIDALDLRNGQQVTILRGGGRPRYVPTGHLLFALNGTLHAVAFDAHRLEVRGEPIELIAEPGSSEFVASDEGTLVYVATGASQGVELVWVDRRGREEFLGAPPRAYNYPRLSPDGKQVALDVRG